MSNINDATFLQGMIDAAKLKKDQSQAVIDDHATSSQAAIDAAKAEIASLEAQISNYETQIADYNSQLEDPPTTTQKSGRGKGARTKTVVDQAEVNRITAERNATQAQLQTAKTDVAAAQVEAATAEQALADGPDVVDPTYAEAQKMFGLLGHLDKLIALKTTGQSVSDAEMNTFNDNLTHLQTELEDNMGAEFVTQFWADVEAGIITLKELGTDGDGDGGGDGTGDALADVKNFYDAALADENSTERQELNDINDLIFGKLVARIVPGDVHTLGNDDLVALEFVTLPSLLGQIASITGDSSVDGDFDGYAGAVQELLIKAGMDTYDETAELSNSDYHDILAVINQNSTSGLLLSDADTQKYLDTLQDIQDERADVLAQINEAYDTGNDDQITSLLAKAHGLSQSFNTINQVVNGTDNGGGGIDDPVPDLPVNASEEVDYAQFKMDFYDEQIGQFNTMLEELEGDDSSFGRAQRQLIEDQIALVNEAKSFWNERKEFWGSYDSLISGVTDQDVLQRINDYAVQIIEAEGEADMYLADDTDEANENVANSKASIAEYIRRINLLVTNGSEGFVGAPEEEGIYNAIYNGLLPENVETEGPKIAALNTFLADKLMEATLAANNTGYTMPELLTDIEGIMGEDFAEAAKTYLEYSFFDTDNTTNSVSAEALVKLMGVIKDYSGELTYLSDDNKADIEADLTKLGDLQALILEKADQINDPNADPYTQTLPEFLAEVASLLGDTEENGQYTGLTGAIAQGLSEYDVNDTESPLTIEELSSITDNIFSIRELYDDLNITNIDVNRADRAMNAYFYADEALETALLDRKSAYETIDDLDTRIAAVRAGESEESLEALTLEKNKYLSFVEFTKASEEFWSYEKAFSYDEQNEEALLAMYEQMRAQEEDFMTATLGEVGVPSSLSISDYGDKIEAINILREGLSTLRGGSISYGYPIPNPGFVDEASYASYKAELLAKQSEELAAEKAALEDALVNGHDTLSPSQVQQRINQITLEQSITDFTKDFWAEENEFYQSLFKLDISNDKADLLNHYLNQLSALQRDIEIWMGQLSSNSQAGRVARTKITRGRQQILGLKDQIRGLSS